MPGRRDIAIIGYAQTPAMARAQETEVQFLLPTINSALEKANISRKDIGFTCAGSCDYLVGPDVRVRQNLEAVGAWPPISESHVEMDGAWAMYEAWVRLQQGDIDTRAGVRLGQVVARRARRRSIRCSSTRTTSRRSAWTRGRSPRSRRGRCSTRGRPPSATSPRSWRAAAANADGNPNAQVSGNVRRRRAARRAVRAPHRCGAHDLAAGVRRRVPRSCSPPPTRRVSSSSGRRGSRGIDHRIDVHQPGVRDLTVSPSTALAAEGAGVGDGPGRGRRALGAVQSAGADPARTRSASTTRSR